MIQIELPQLRATDIVAITIEEAAINGIPVWIVTSREAPTMPTKRRWHPNEASAIAHAAEQADRLGLLLIDLRSQGEPE